MRLSGPPAHGLIRVSWSRVLQAQDRGLVTPCLPAHAALQRPDLPLQFADPHFFRIREKGTGVRQTGHGLHKSAERLGTAFTVAQRRPGTRGVCQPAGTFRS